MTISALIFPGQGGQFVGQGALWANNPKLADLFLLAEETSGLPITRLCREGPLDDLSKTINLQPAILTVSLAAARLLVESGIKPAFAAGHSLGEFGALVAAGVLTEREALTLVAKRAALMQANAEKQPGAMAAILKLEPEELEKVCELARAEGQVVLANFNGPGQTVISGQSRAVAAAVKYAKLKGARTVPLPVSGGFHSPLMEESGLAFALELDKVEFRRPNFPVVPNTQGFPEEDPAKLKELLKKQITSPVLWTQTIDSLLAAGVDDFAECWPKPYMGSIIGKCLEPNSSITIRCQA